MNQTENETRDEYFVCGLQKPVEQRASFFCLLWGGIVGIFLISARFTNFSSSFFQMADQLFIQDVSRYRLMTRDQLVEERTCLMLNIDSELEVELKTTFRLKLCLVMSSLKQLSLANGATRFKWRSWLKLTTTKSDYIWTAQGDLLWRIIDRFPQHRKLPDKSVQCQKLVKLVRTPYRLATWLAVAQRFRQDPEQCLSDLLTQTIQSLPDSWKPVRRLRKSSSEPSPPTPPSRLRSHPYQQPTEDPVTVSEPIGRWSPAPEEIRQHEYSYPFQYPLLTDTYQDTFDVSQYLCV